MLGRNRSAALVVAGTLLTVVLTGPSASALSYAATSTQLPAAPSWVSIGDFNEDGKPDLAASLINGGSVSVLLGNALGGFSTIPGATVSANNPFAVVVADFNDDGHQDLAMPDGGTATVTVDLGDGRGGFTQPSGSPFPTGGAGMFSIVAGDVNGDGVPDIATGNFSSNDVTVLLSDGSGGFTPASGSPFAAGTNPGAIAMGDVNHDGKLDLAVGDNGSGKVTVLLGNGAGGFAPASNSPFTVGTAPNGVAIGDLNADGKPDLAVANTNSHNVSILLGDGTGSFSNATGSPIAAGSPFGIAIADMNADGRPDVVVGGGGGATNRILLGDGSGGFSPDTFPGTGPGVAIGDINGDGKPDIALATSFPAKVMVLLDTSQPVASPSPASVPFGSRTVGSAGAAQTVTITNTGDALLHVGKVNVEGTNPDDFVISGETCDDGPVLGHGTCTVRVRFDPQDVGARAATLRVFSDDPAGRSSAALSGTGVAPPPPNTTIVGQPPALTNDPTPTFRFSSNDAGATFQCRLDGAAFADCSSPDTLSSLADGSHTFRVRAVAGGGMDPTPDAFTFTVDATPPDVTIDGPNQTKDTTPTFAFGYSEEVAAVRCKIDNAANFHPCSDPYTTPTLAVGAHVLFVKAIDDAGNRTSPPAQKTFKVVT